MLELVRGDSRPELVAGELEAFAIPVIVCLWTRPDRFQDVLDNLSKQQSARLRLIVWNNRPENSPRYLAELAKHGATGALASVEFFTSPDNIGGIARFVAAHQLVRDGYRGPFITFDDDQDVSPSLITDLMAEHREDTVAGQWAWVYDDNYWDRVQARPGEQATYVGTPGAVFHTDAVADDRFFTELPARYGFLEDIWSSYWIASAGGRLRKVETPSAFVEEELNQFHALVDLKVEFARYLKDRPRQG